MNMSTEHSHRREWGGMGERTSPPGRKGRWGERRGAQRVHGYTRSATGEVPTRGQAVRGIGTSWRRTYPPCLPRGRHGLLLIGTELALIRNIGTRSAGAERRPKAPRARRMPRIRPRPDNPPAPPTERRDGRRPTQRAAAMGGDATWHMPALKWLASSVVCMKHAACIQPN